MIVATATLFVEQKFIRNGGKAAHVEDVVVDNSTRGAQRLFYTVCHFTCEGQGVGKAIIKKLVRIAKKMGCYKVILDCDDKNVQFYQKCGFDISHSSEFMARYF